MDMRNHFIGYKWLANHFNLPFNHFHESRIGTKLKQYQHADGSVIDEYTSQYYPGDRVVDHVQFAIKHEGLNLRLLKQVFTIHDQNEFAQYINQFPTGKYARQIGFLYEFLVGEEMQGINTLGGNYVHIVDPDSYVVPEGVTNTRWRVYDNLPGGPRFCPLVRKTDLIRTYLAIDFSNEVKAGYADIDPRLFQRAVNYLYLKETKSSNEIEHERPGLKREERFVELLKHAGSINMASRLTEEGLAECQSAITDERFNRDTFRGDQNYVGEHSRYGLRPIIHLIGMPPEYLEGVMSGVQEYEGRTKGLNTIVRAATISFSFVFIHPFDDGNGRVHRFLINDILSNDGLLEKGVILPVSAVMVRNEPRYTEILESFSVPLMKAVDYDIDIDHRVTVNNPEDIEGYYRYPDLTRQTEYLFSVVEETIRVDLVDEIKTIMSFDSFREKVKQVIDMPNRETELLMKLIHENHGVLSNNKRKSHFDFLNDDEVYEIESAYQKAFNGVADDEDAGFHPR